MMNNDSKIAGNFLEAIRKYADKQKQQIENEVNEFKQAELKKAEDESLEFAYDFIQKEMVQQRMLIRTELARKEQESRAELFKLRKEMTDKVFAGARKKLTAYTSTKEYKDKLLKSAAKMAEIFKANECTIYVKKSDLRYADELSSVFSGKAEIESDASIQIGGLKGKCPKLNITADDTLDTLLDAQKEWFALNSDLKVV